MENQLCIEVVSLLNPISTPLIPSNSSPHTVCPFSDIVGSPFVQVFTEHVAKAGWKARAAEVWPSPRRRAKGRSFSGCYSELQQTHQVGEFIT